MVGNANVIQMYCPNCAKRIYGYVNAKGMAFFNCGKCGCSLSSKKMKAQKVVITVNQQN